MPLIKGKNVKEVREPCCGCMIKWYPIPETADLTDWLAVRRSLDMEEKWAMQEHKHKDFEEYWFVIEGTGKFYIGDEVYDVEPGDLAITPRGVPHKAKGDFTFVCCMAKHNVFGQSCGGRQPFEATNKPYRDEPEEMPEIGQYMEVDVMAKH